MKPNHQVLIVDGNPNDVQVVRKTLEAAGLSIHVRTDGSSAIEAFHTIKPDVVLIDVQVPETDGVRVSRELKQTDLGRATPIILMSRRTLKAKERKHALSASGCALLLQKPVSSKQIIETLSKLLPNAFVPQAEESAGTDETPTETVQAPPDIAPIQASAQHSEDAPLLDPEALNDDVLGALFDQVFPTSDAGDLAGAIAAKTHAAPAADPDHAPGKTPVSARAGMAPDLSAAKPRRRPAFDASEDSLSSLLDEALPTPTSVSSPPSVQAEIVDRPASGESSKPLGASDHGTGAAILDGEVVATSVTGSPSAPDELAPSVTGSPSAPDELATSVTGSPSASDELAPHSAEPPSEPLAIGMTHAKPPSPSSSGSSRIGPPFGTMPGDAPASDIPVTSPADDAPAHELPRESKPAKAEVEIVAPPAAGQDSRGRGKKSKGHRRDRPSSTHTESVHSIPLSPAPAQSQTATPAPEPTSFMAEEDNAAVIRTTLIVRPASETPTVDPGPAPRSGRVLTILFFLLAAATILYILLRHQGDQDLRPASRATPQGSQSGQVQQGASPSSPEATTAAVCRAGRDVADLPQSLS